MKLKKVTAVIVSSILTLSLLTGCGGTPDVTSSSESTSASTSTSTEESSSAASIEETASEEKVEGGTLTFLIDTDVSLAGFKAVAALAEEKLGIVIEYETRPGGEDGDNIVKTRLASGDMTDIMGYNSGALLSALNPSEYFIDISGEEFASKLDETYKASVSSDSETYGIPLGSSQAGAILYNKPMYEKYGLEVPKTWNEFIANCDVLKEAGETAILGSFADSWTSQVMFLGDNYNVVSQNPDFVANFEAGEVKYATSPEALKSFEKLEATNEYYNSDYLATTYDDACDMMANGEAGHWVMLTQALSNIYELYGDQVNDIGVFAVPGDDAGDNGLTLWMPTSIYGNKNSDKQDLIKKFMEFYISDEALDAYTAALLPDGPFCVNGYELPENAYTAVAEDMQAYFDAGKTGVAMEFLTPVKGSDALAICQELGSGQTTALQAAEKYDRSCEKQALQLGLDW